MKHPKIGEVIYAYSDKQGRVGETHFLSSTQNNATKDKDALYKEAIEIFCNPNSETWDDDKNDWVPTKDYERNKDIIIYEMKRIQ